MLQGQTRLHSPVNWPSAQVPSPCSLLFVFLNSSLRLHAAHRAYVANVHETASDEHVFFGFHRLITARTSNDRRFAHLALHAPPQLSRSLPYHRPASPQRTKTKVRCSMLRLILASLVLAISILPLYAQSPSCTRIDLVIRQGFLPCVTAPTNVPPAVLGSS